MLYLVEAIFLQGFGGCQGIYPVGSGGEQCLRGSMKGCAGRGNIIEKQNRFVLHRAGGGSECGLDIFTTFCGAQSHLGTSMPDTLESIGKVFPLHNA